MQRKRNVRKWMKRRRGLIPPENYGGRKRHRSIEQSLNYRLTCDILRVRKKAAILASTDAKGCFDRIVHAIAFICLRRWGLPSAPIQSMIHAIQVMTHYVRVAFGDSTDSYGYDATQPHLPPLMGLLQGNGASGTGWQAVSSVLVEMLKARGWGGCWICSCVCVSRVCSGTRRSRRLTVCRLSHSMLG